VLVTVALEPVMTSPGGRTGYDHSMPSGVGCMLEETARLRTINIQPLALLTDLHVLLLTAAMHLL